MTERANAMIVTLTVEQLKALVRSELKEMEARLANAGPKEVLLLEEAAEFLGYHSKAVVKRAKPGEIPAHKIGQEWRFLRSELIAYVAAQPVPKDEVA